MTIEFNRNAHTFTLSSGKQTKTVAEQVLRAIANVQGWGDVQSVIEAAQQNPGCAIPVDNDPRRGHYVRNSRQYAILQ